MALFARPFRRNTLPLGLLTLEDRTVPTVSFPDWTVGRYPFGWLGGHDTERFDVGDTRFVSNPDGYLTGPQAGSRDDLARQNLREFAGLLNIPAADARPDGARVVTSFADQVGSGQHVHLMQQVNGLVVLNSMVQAHYTADGRLSVLTGGFFPGMAALDGQPLPTIAVRPEVAVVEAAYQVGYDVNVEPKVESRTYDAARTTVLSSPEASDQPITAQLAYAFSAGVGVRPVWHFNLRTPDGENWYDVGVDVQSGEVLMSSNWADHFGTYRALAFPNESPVDPQAGGQRTYEVNPYDSKWSPFGWHDTDGKAGAEFSDTRGNNVSAQLDLGSTNPTIATPTAGGNRPDGGPYRTFDNPYNFALEPTVASQRDALVTNLFYANNMNHDVHAAYGFTEAAGNFQFTNYSGQGKGGDQVHADAQDGSGTDNANMFTPPDGTPGRMQMYRFTFSTPGADSDLDNGIIHHEFGHGVSNRLTAPATANGLTAAQSGAMGEGWSDFWALMFTQVPVDKAGDRYPIGTWALGQNPNTGGGIRAPEFGVPGGKPYSFDLNINTMNFAEHGTVYNVATNGPHAGGARWASALWDLNWLLIAKYGFDPDLSTGYDPATLAGRAGNKLTLRLVSDGLKLQGSNPSFIVARDAILQADVNLTGGVNRREIWTAFARRSLGFGSSTTGAGQTTALTTTKALPAAGDNPGVVGLLAPGRTIGGAAPGSVTFTFSEAMNTASFAVAADVASFTGPGGADILGRITGFTWVNSTTLQINFTPPAATAAQGTYTLVLGPNVLSADNGSALDQTFNGTAGEAGDTFAAVFGYDAAQLAVTAISPVNGANVDPSVAAVDVTFNEAVDPGSVSKGDLQLSQGDGFVTSASVLADGKTVRFAVAGLNEANTFVQVRYNGVTDPFGFATSKFYSAFNVDVVTAAFPVPLTPVGPRGSLAYTGSRPNGLITGAADTDSFTLPMDAGQQLSVTLDQTTSLRGRLTILAPDGTTLGTALAATAGQSVTVGPFLTVAGTYTLRAGGDGTTTGTYRVGVLVNAGTEPEAAGGASNNTLATAQPLGAAFLTVAGGGGVATVTAKSDLFLNVLPAEAEPNNTTATANRAAANFAATPTTTFYQFTAVGSTGTASGSTFDRDYFNVGTLNPGDFLTVTLQGSPSGRGTLGDPFLEIYRDNGGTPALVTSDDDGGIGFESQVFRFPVATGDKYYLVARPFSTTTASGTYALSALLERPTGPGPTAGGPLVDDTEAATAIGGNDTAATAQDASAAWRQPNFRSQTTGTVTAGDVDTFSYVLTAGDVATFRVVNTGTTAVPTAKLFNAAGVQLTLETSESIETFGTPRTAGVYSFRVPATGTYFFQTQASSTTATSPYTVDVLLSTPTPPPGIGGTPDLYSFALGAGDVVSVGLARLGSPTAALALLDPAGTVVATGAAAGNYTQGVNRFVAPATGTYYVRVTDTVPDGDTYAVTVARNAVLDLEGNDTPATANPSGLGGGDPRTVVGAIGTAGDVDFFTLTLAGESSVRMVTNTPGGGPGQFVNDLVPVLDLFNPAGDLVATATANRPDGRNAVLTFAVPAGAGGTYRVRVGGAGTVGEYTLSTAGVSAGGPYTVAEGQPLGFQAVVFDIDGAVTFDWDFNADGTFGDATGASPTLTWAQLQSFGIDDGPGSKAVRVRASDGVNPPVISPAAAVVITNTAPTATFAPQSVPEGGGGTLTVTGAADQSAADTAAGFKYAYDFNNDGTFDAGGTTFATGVGSTVTVPAASTPNGPATFLARVRVMDKDNGATEYTALVTVTNVAPTATITNKGPVNEGGTVQVQATNVSDPSAEDKAATFRYAFDFDNNPATGTNGFEDGDGTYAGSLTGSARLVPSTFLADGAAERVVRVRVIDRDGGAFDGTTTISVLNVAPTGKFATTSTKVTEGGTGEVQFTTNSASDPSAADRAAGFRFAYDFDNDGDFDLGDGTYAGSPATAKVTVPAEFLPDDGTFTVRGLLIDKDNGSTAYTTTITVGNAPPTASVAPVPDVPEGSGTTVTVVGATDSSPADVAAGLRYAFDFDNDGAFDLGGDGTYATAQTSPVGAADARFFADEGVVTVTARVIDKNDGFTDYEVAVTVLGVAPTATVSPVAPVAEGSAATLTFTGATDVSPADRAAGFRYAVKLAGAADWLAGDGTFDGSQLAPTAVLPASLFVNGPGTVELVARVIDKDNKFTDYPTSVTVTNVAPTGSLLTGGPVLEGQTGSVRFTAQADPSPADVAAGFTYAWDFDNDGTFDLGSATAGGPDALVTVPAGFFPDGGAGKLLTVRGRIFDRDGGFSDATATIAIQNAAPTGVAGNGGGVTEGQTATVSLTGGTDASAADAAALRYSFDFNADGTFEVGDGTYAGSGTASTATVPASFLDDGPSGRAVRIRVIDKDGGFSQYTTVVPVANASPTATLFNPGPVAEGEDGTVTFAGPTDPSAADRAAGFRYAYDFDNDGKFELGGDTYAKSVTAATATVPAAFFAEGPGGTTVRARIYDKDGGFSEYLTELTVGNVPPTGTFAAEQGVQEGLNPTVGFSGVSDPSADDTAAGFRFAFDFDNDGVFEVGGDGTFAQGATSATALVPNSFVLDGPASRTVRGRVIDRNNGFTDYVTTIGVVNTPPTAVLRSTAAATIGSPVTLALTEVFDVSPVDTAAGFTYSFDFDGDGLFEVSGSSPSASFVYPTPGVRRVAAQVSDKDGGSTVYNAVVTVENAPPTASFASLGSVPEGGRGAVRFLDPAQPSPTTTAAGFRYSFDLDGDGRFDVGDGTYAGSVTSPEAALPAALTADAGTRTVRGRIVEVNGLSTDYTTTVTVTNVLPTANPLPASGGSGPNGTPVAGDSVTVGVNGATDGSPTDRAGLTYSFDFTGDGTFEVTGSKVATAAAVYPAAGSFTAVVRVTDPKGGFTDYRVPVAVASPPPTVPPAVPNFYAVGSGTGGAARLFDDFGREVYAGQPLGDAQGVRVATGDVTGDGVPDLVSGTGPGTVTRVVVIDGKTGATVLDVQPFEATFTGGVFVAAGDTDGDGRAEVVVTPDVGGGPVVAVYRAGGQQVNRFFGIEDPDFRGGARAALADIDGDGNSDLLAAAGVGGGPRLAVFDGESLGNQPVKLMSDFFVFEQTLRNGVFVAGGDLTGDGAAEVVVGGGPGGGPRVFALDGAALMAGRQVPVANFFAGDPDDRDGVRVAVADLDLDRDVDVLAATAEPGADGFRVRGYKSSDLVAGQSPERFLLDPFPGDVGGVFVG